MNKSSIRILLLIPLIAFCLGCQKNEDTPTSSFTTDISGTSSSNKYANVPTNFIIRVSKDTGKDRIKYLLRYLNESGKGELYIRSQKIEADKQIEFSESELPVSYFPLTLGEHRLRFQLIQDGYETETVYGLSVQDYSASVSPFPMADKIYVNQGVYIDFSLTQKNNNGDFSARVNIIKGSGKVFIVENPQQTKSPRIDTAIITPIAINDSSIMAQLKSRSDNLYNIKTGNNRIYFHPDSSGEHTIRLNLVNSFGYEQSFNLNFDVLIPEFSAIAENDTCIILGKSGNFILKIQNPVSEEIYTTFRFLKNSGRVFINSNEVGESKEFPLMPGTYNGQYLPASAGNAKIEFSIRDRYSKNKKGTMEFSVISSQITMNLEKPQEAFSGEKAKLKMTINQKDYSGQYTSLIRTLPADAGTFLLNGMLYTENTRLKNGENILDFTPNRSGLIRIDITVTDEKNTSAEGYLELNVNESIQDIRIKEYNPIIPTTGSETIHFDIIKPECYTGKYYCEILQQPTSAGKIYINGKAYISGKIPVNKSGNKFSFFPEVTGEISLNLIIHTDDDKIISKTLSFTSLNSELNTEITGYRKDIQTGSGTEFSFSTKKEGYSGTFQYYITQNPENAGNIKINGNIYFTESRETVMNNTSVLINFIPMKPGPATLILHILDGLKETTYPLVFDITTPPIQIDVNDFNAATYIGQENICHISVAKANYNDLFKCRVTTFPPNAGKIKLNDYLSNENSWSFSAGDQILGFTPTINGNVRLNLTITDIYGEISTKNLEYQVKKTNLNLLVIDSIKESIDIDTRGKFTIAAEKEGYQGKYFIEINGSGYKSLKLSDILYFEKTVIPDPENIPISFLPIGTTPVCVNVRITDEEGGRAEKAFLCTINEPELDLTLFPGESNLSMGETTNFIFTPHKGQETLLYELAVIPANAGKFFINDKEYGGKTDVVSGTAVNVKYVPLQAGSAEISVIVTDKNGNIAKKGCTYTIKDKETQSILEITASDIENKNLIVGQETDFHIHVKENGDYKGKYKYSINIGICDIKINGKPYTIDNKIEATLEEIQDLKVTIVPKEPTSMDFSFFIGGESEDFELGRASYEYLDIPAEFIIERNMTNSGSYTFQWRYQYWDYDNPEGERQVQIGKMSGSLDPNSGTNKITTSLNPIRVYHSYDNKGKIGITYDMGIIIWKNSPEQQVTYAMDIINPNGDIIAHYLSSNSNLLGTFSGNKTWYGFGGNFICDEFIPWALLKAGGCRVKIYYTLENNQSSLDITGTDISHDLIIGQEAKFNIHVTENGNYNGPYKYRIMSYAQIKVNGKTIVPGDYYPVTIGDLGNMEITVIPTEEEIQSITIRIMDQNNKFTDKTFTPCVAKREFIEVPAEFVIERKANNQGRYSIKAGIQYRNQLKENSREVTVGNVSLTLEPGQTNTTSQSLSPVRIFRSSTNEGWLDMQSISTAISWQDSPVQSSSYMVDVLTSDGNLLAQYLIRSTEHQGGVFSGNKEWKFSTTFNCDEFIDNWDALKKPGTRIRVYYLLEESGNQ